MSRAWDTLMIAGQAGDGPAYRHLLDDLQTWLERYYRRRLDPDSDDDAVQDVLISFHPGRHTYGDGRLFGPCLAAIARYKWIHRLRSMTARPLEMLPEGDAVPKHGNGRYGIRGDRRDCSRTARDVEAGTSERHPLGQAARLQHRRSSNGDRTRYGAGQSQHPQGFGSIGQTSRRARR